LSWIAVLLILVPLVVVFVRLFSDESYHGSLGRVFALPGLGRTLLNTVAVIGASTVLAVVVACLLAWLNERTNARLGFLTDVLPVMPMLVPSIAGAIGWVLLAAPTAGFINVVLRSVHLPVVDIFSWPGLIFVYTIYLVPQVYLTVAAALRTLDPGLEEAARISGAGPFRTLRTVTLPAVKPAVLSGALLALVYGIALFSVPLIIGTQARIDILTVQVVRMLAFTFPPRIGEALILSLLVAVVLALLWWVNARIVRRGHFATIGGRHSARPTIVLRPVSLVIGRIVLLGFVLLAAVLPLLALVLVSFQGFWSGKFVTVFTVRNYRTVFGAGSQTLNGLVNSLVLGLVAATVTILLAVLIWYRVTGPGAHRGGRFIDGVTKLPGALSHMVIGVALLAVLGGPPLGLSGTLTLLIVAYVVLYLPQASVSAQSANQMVGGELSEASWVSGRGRGATVRKIVLPLARSGLISGWTFVFVLVAGDITASSLLASPSNPVVGFVITTLFQNGTYPLLAALGAVISVVSSVVVLTALSLANRRRRYRSDRQSRRST
jgi:iron(III) transport system permease protein